MEGAAGSTVLGGDRLIRCPLDGVSLGSTFPCAPSTSPTLHLSKELQLRAVYLPFSNCLLIFVNTLPFCLDINFNVCIFFLR